MINKKKIELETKELLNKFSKKLEEIKGLKEETAIIRNNGLRGEGNGKDVKDLKEKILKNSKNKSKDFIIAKEKSW